MRALGSIGEPSDSAVAFLETAATTDAWPEMRLGALEVLARHGSAARAATTFSRKALRDTIPEVRAAAIRAIRAGTRAAPAGTRAAP